MLWTVLFAVGLLIILALGVYAGRLLFLLKLQNTRQQAAKKARIESITTSIETISLAMEQQQCDLSEGVIRIVNLLSALPIETSYNYTEKFPHTHALFSAVSGFAILEARKKLSKQERFQQDKQREQIESEHEAKVLPEMSAIRAFCQSL